MSDQRNPTRLQDEDDWLFLKTRRPRARAMPAKSDAAMPAGE
jgi:hypothetical protein